MRHRARMLVGALILAGSCSGALAAGAAANIAWAPCADNNYACALVAVPLDHSGNVPGTIQIAIRRKRSLVGDGSDAVLGLAGGPGQAAIPLADRLAAELGPALATRDLIVLDQRGTGLSGALHCKPLDTNSSDNPPGALLLAGCARKLGATAPFYRTADSVADIETVRQAAGYSKLVPYGTSYGTEVALAYARRYPSHVEGLLLDSTVGPDGVDALNRPTFAAIPRVIAQLCGSGACAHITQHPYLDLANLLARLRSRPLRGRVFDGSGVGHEVSVSEHDMVDLLVEGDLDPTLRLELPGSVRSALDGDNAPLARLRALAASGSGGNDPTFDNTLFFATTCEDQVFPWQPLSDPAAKLRQATAAAAALPRATFAPFDAGTAVYTSAFARCNAWPGTTTGDLHTAPDSAPLPNVPTLILSGADDLRTPTEGARAVAAQIPDARLVVVPHTGHSVLDSDYGSCASDAVRAFYSLKKVHPCHETLPQALLRPAPIAPLHLSDLRPIGGATGKPGRTLEAIVRTLADVQAEVISNLISNLSAGGPTSARAGGLRGGWVQAGVNGEQLHNVSYVPGVTVSGSFESRSDVLTIGGPAAARGVLRASADGTFNGTLGGQTVHLGPTAVSAKLAKVASIARRRAGLGVAQGRR